MLVKEGGSMLVKETLLSGSMLVMVYITLLLANMILEERSSNVSV